MKISSSSEDIMQKSLLKWTRLLAGVSLFFGAAACGGGGGGGELDPTLSTTIQGTLSNDTRTGRVLGAGQGGIAEVTVSALGRSTETDEFGNFNLLIDAEEFSGGSVLFELSGPGVETSVALDGVMGGAGVTAFVDMFRQPDGEVVAESTDVNGNLLGLSPGYLGCDSTDDFSDGGYGALWKPISESTGTVVILMPPEYQNADVQILNRDGNPVASPIRRDCCEHNGGREHIYLDRSAGALAGAGTPLTVRFEFAGGVVDCREVENPQQRYD